MRASRHAAACRSARDAILAAGCPLWSHINTDQITLPPRADEDLVCSAICSCIQESIRSLAIELPDQLLTNVVLETVAQRISGTKLASVSFRGRYLFLPARLGFGLVMLLNEASLCKELILTDNNFTR